MPALVIEVKEGMKAKGIEKPIVASLAGDVQVEEAAEYLCDHGVVAYPYSPTRTRLPVLAYPYSMETPVDVPGAKYRWARAAGLL